MIMFRNLSRMEAALIATTLLMTLAPLVPYALLG
jgi:hypothetical protein